MHNLIKIPIYNALIVFIHLHDEKHEVDDKLSKNKSTLDDFKLQLPHVDSMVEWFVRWDCDQYAFGLKSTRTILLCPWERHFTALSPAWWSWQAVLNFGHISIKLKKQK